MVDNPYENDDDILNAYYNSAVFVAVVDDDDDVADVELCWLWWLLCMQIPSSVFTQTCVLEQFLNCLVNKIKGTRRDSPDMLCSNADCLRMRLHQLVDKLTRTIRPHLLPAAVNSCQAALLASISSAALFRISAFRPSTASFTVSHTQIPLAPTRHSFLFFSFIDIPLRLT